MAKRGYRDRGRGQQQPADDGGFSTDPDDYGGGGWSALPEGDWSVYITGAAVTVSKSGKPMMALRYTVLDPDYSEKEIRDWCVFEGLGWSRLANICRAIDPSMKGIRQDPQNGFNPRDQESVDQYLMGAALGIRIIHVQDGEYTRERIKGSTKGDGFKIPDGYYLLTDAELDKLEGIYSTGPDGGEITPALPSDALTWGRDDGMF